MQELTVYEIAKMAGVSVATVSKVLNNRTGVHVDTAAKVREVLNHTGFKPRWCASTGIKTVAFIIPPYVGNLADYYNGQVFSSCFEALRREGYASLCLTQMQAEQLCRDGGDLGMTLSISGIITFGNPATYDFCRKLIQLRDRLPVVIIGRISEKEEILPGNLVNDDFSAGFQAAQLLLAQNHRDFMIVSPKMENIDHRNRVNGIMAALKDKENICCRHIIVEGDLRGNGEKLALNLASSNERPDCLLFTNGVNCASFVSSCRYLKMPIPEMFSVIGFEDGEELTFLSPPVTAMRNPAIEIGERAIELLLSQLEKKNRRAVEPIKHQLVLRHSVRMNFV